ncbi:MAG: hypothetical protein QM731_06080 [Chitinophagaceae bacterium]
MKKVLPAVIALAAVAAIYYLYTHKQHSPTPANEKLIGYWKLDSIGTKASDSNAANIIATIALMLTSDSSLQNSGYQFRQDGIVIKKITTSTAADSSRYQWLNDSTLTWYENISDTTGEKLLVTLPDATHMTLTASDSAILHFTKQP